MASTDVPRIRVSDPGELIETVPYLLGFHPQFSLVLLGFRGLGPDQPALGEVQVAMRVDLPHRLPAQGLPRSELAPMVNALLRAEASTAICLIFSDRDAIGSEGPAGGAPPGRPRDWDDLCATVADAIEDAGLRVADTLIVSASRWWSLVEEAAQGHARRGASAASAAQATFAGLVALPDRASLDAQLDGFPLRVRRRLQPQLELAEHRVVQAALEHRADRMAQTDLRALQAAALAWAGPQRPKPMRQRQLARFNWRDSAWPWASSASVTSSGWRSTTAPSTPRS